jgi:hypothetical protein
MAHPAAYGDRLKWTSAMKRLLLAFVPCVLGLRAGAAVVAEAVAPLAELAQRTPALRREAVLQLATLPTLARLAPAALAAAPLPSAAPAAASAVVRDQAALLVAALAARPDEPALHAALGVENAPALRAAAAAFAREEREHPASPLSRRLQEIRRRWDLTSPSGARDLAARLAETFDGLKLPERDADRDSVVMNLRAAAAGAPYAHVNLGRAYETGSGTAENAALSYHWYGLAALLGESAASAPLRALESRMSPDEVLLARRLVLRRAQEDGLLREEPGETALRSRDFPEELRRLARPRAYLAGPWGFPDFNHEKDAYGRRYIEAARVAPFAPGAEMLRLIAADVAALGYQVLNPWTNTFPAQLLGGVLFGAGVDLDGRPWSEGSLAAGTLSLESLRHWLAVLGRDFRVDPAAAAGLSAAELEEAFRSRLGDMVYRGNKRHIESADVAFVNMNAYRGDVDDGTLWELIRALETGKEAVVLVDERPEETLGEPIFGRGSFWNQMVNGYLKEHSERVRVFHRIDDVLDYLSATTAARPPAAAAGAAARGERPRYDRLTGALDSYLRDRGYARALRALEFARERHRGRRRDGVTPEFQHQVEIALYLTTLKDLPDEEQALTVALLHDVVEDYDVAPEELERLFGADVARRVWLLTKIYRGEAKDPDAYFDAISRDPIASLVKGADRVHNLQSMVGVFSPDKQREYADEAERRFLPMLKDAERRFPGHGAAYRNIRHMIKSQLALIRAALAR